MKLQDYLKTLNESEPISNNTINKPALDKACKECLGCNRMEMSNWVEPEYCIGSPDEDRQVKPVQMVLGGR